MNRPQDSRILFFFLFFWVLGMAFVYQPHIFAQDASQSRAEKNEFELTYQGEIKIPVHEKAIEVWIPLASSREGQKILERKINLPVKCQIFREPIYGNEMVYFKAEKAGSLIPFSIQYHALTDRNYFNKRAAQGETTLYLEPSRLMSEDGRIREIAKSVVSPKASFSEKAKSIYNYVITHMQYDKTTPGWGSGDTRRACEVGKGNCTDFHSLFISVAHAAEIPARFKIGFQVPTDSGGAITGYHCWAEFSDEKRNWNPVDASEAWKHPEKQAYYFARFDPNKFLISMGRDIDLVPRQKGEPVNIFFYPYVESDGKVIAGSARMEFSYKNLK
ncbi:MAG: transglutaminase domain-containing protein [Candidatus Omnitrophica bacterium]|nr:transglutaminase domain-containing protein [Candidatus Omnitrophota bacterium]